jgi:multidrug efflux pump
VFLFGARDYAMRIWLDPQKLSSLNMTAGDVTRAIREQNVQVAAGVVGAPPLPEQANPLQLTVNAQGRLTSEEEFGAIVVRTGENGAITRVRDVARVERGARDYAVTPTPTGRNRSRCRSSSSPAPTRCRRATRSSERWRSCPPAPTGPGRDLARPLRHDVFVRQSMKDVVTTLVEAILLVVIVVVVFLQSWRASVIPLAAGAGLADRHVRGHVGDGFSLNNLSMFGSCWRSASSSTTRSSSSRTSSGGSSRAWRRARRPTAR